MKQNFVTRTALLLLFMLFTLVSNAHDFEVDGIYYKINNDGTSVSVTYEGDYAVAPEHMYSGNVNIPSVVTYNGNTYTVTSIGSSAFFRCWELITVNIPNSVTSIGDDAFWDCGLLTTVNISDSVITIGERAFQRCSSLTSVTIGKSVKSIGDLAFERTGLGSVVWNAINCNDGYSFSEVEQYDNKITDFSFGDDVKRIPASLCADLTGLTLVDIPNSVTEIGSSAFSNCIGITNVTIGNSVALIGNYAFEGCMGLTSVIIPNSAKIVGDCAFRMCCSLTSVNIGNSVTEIGDYAFEECTSLTEVAIPNSVTKIGQQAFFYCPSLSSVLIGKSVTSIGQRAFLGCEDLASIIVVSENLKYDSRNNCNAIIETSSNTLIFGCKGTRIPNSVLSVSNFAFENCFGLTSLVIPNSVNSIGYNAFSGCTGLKSVILTGQGGWNYNSSNYQGLSEIISQLKTVNIGSGITSLGNFGFAADRINCYAAIPPTCSSGTFANYDGELHVPVASTAAYFMAEYWQNFNNLTNDLTEGVVLNISEVDMVKGGTITLTATTNPENEDVVWITSNPLVAQVNDAGVVTAIGGGECYVFATLESNTAVYASCHVSSSYPEISVSLNTDIIEMRYGEEATLVATITPENLGLEPTWSSSDTSVATVDNGVVTAVGEGECDIIVSVLDKIATCHVVVNSDVVISLSKDNDIIGVNQILTVYPTCSPDVPVDFVVTSSDPNVAMVRLINRSNAPSVGIFNFTEKGQAIIHANMLTSASSKSPAYANEKAIMIVGVSYGSATIIVGSVDGKAIPATLELRVVDVDGDGTVTAADITALYDYLLNGDQSHITTSDVDGDGAITSADITAVYNILLGN